MRCWSAISENGEEMANSTFYDNVRQLKERYGIQVLSEDGHYTLAEMSPKEQQLYDAIFDYTDQNEVKKCRENHALLEEPSPVEGPYLAEIANAINSRRWVEMDYAPYNKTSYTTRFAPYCLRIAQGRCYVIGKSSRHQEVRNFALDRIQKFVLTDEWFRKDSTFSVYDYFRYSFGAFGGMNLLPENIVLETAPRLTPYLRSRPLHSTQTEQAQAETKDWTRFSLRLAPTDDFVNELLKQGPWLKVISPESLRTQMRKNAQEILKHYE